MSKSRGRILKQSVLSSAITATLLIGTATETQADIYKFTFASTCSAGVLDSCSQPGNDWLDRDTDSTGAFGDADTDIDESSDAFFTMLTSGGSALKNDSSPYKLHYYWYGQRTPISGDITLDTSSGAGTASISSFDFFEAGPAIASDITISDIGDGAGDPATGDLWLGNMTFDWNGNNGIPLSLVWDMSGLMDSLSGLDIDNLGAGANALAGGTVGVPPASENMLVDPAGTGDATINVGNVLIATTTLNTTPLCTVTTPDVPPSGGGCMTVAVSGGAPALVDGATNTNEGGTGVGGSPMIDGPFDNFNANFDFKRLQLSGFNDTTAPILTLSSSSISSALDAAFDQNNPGVTVSCNDAIDGTDDIVTAGNSNIAFTVVSNNVDINNEGVYSVVYTCSDNASRHGVISDDPNNLGSATVPVDQVSSSKTLTVTVSDVDRPVISVTSPVTHEACTPYLNTDDNVGLSATDLQDGTIPVSSIVKTDNNTIIGVGNTPNEITATINYDFTDSGTGNPGSIPLAAATQTRTVNVVDSIPPIITVVGGLSTALESTACPGFAASLPNATVVDANSDCNPASPSTISTSDSVTCIVPDGQDTLISNLVYSSADTASTPNIASATSVITVSRSEPVITLIGGGRTFDVGDTYDELGIDIHDVQDGDVVAATVSGTASGITYTITDDIDMSVAGDYTVTYTATDSDSNAATTVTRSVKVGSYASGSNFTMLNPAGTTFGGTNDVVFDWDESELTDVASTNFNMTIVSALPQPFFGNLWTAHHVRVFGPGSYSFDATCTVAQLEAGVSACNNPLVGDQTERFITMTVPAGHAGVHILFDWNGTENIDVVNVWAKNAVWDDPDGSATTKNNLFDGVSGDAPDVTAPWKLVSTDFDADGINGSPMVDGPFIGFFANFNVGPSGTAIRLPYTDEVDVDADFTAKPSTGSMGWLAVLLSPIALLVALRRKFK